MKNWSEILGQLGEDIPLMATPIVPPIHQSSNFSFSSVHAFRKAFENEMDTHLYTRGNNPTTQILRKKIAALEGTEDALIVSSGASAIAIAILSQVQQGDHVICVENPYSWTYKFIKNWLPRFGIEHSFVDGRSLQIIQDNIKNNTKVLMLESPNSLTFDLQDLHSCSQICKQHNIISIIDNSYASPIFQNPVDFGIDIVVHSGTKYLNGHSDVVFGAICTRSDIIKSIFMEQFMPLGTVISPHDSWLVLRGLRTLEIRMERIAKSTQKVISWLKKQDLVKSVIYPFDPTFAQYNLAKAQMRNAGGLFSVIYRIRTIEEMENLCDQMSKTFKLAVSWGGHESLQIPTCTFYNIAGVDPPSLPFNFVRYFIGLEDPDYLIDAFQRAFDNLS